MLSRELFIIYARDFKEVSGVSGNELGTVFSSNQKEESIIIISEISFNLIILCIFYYNK